MQREKKAQAGIMLSCILGCSLLLARPAQAAQPLSPAELSAYTGGQMSDSACSQTEVNCPCTEQDCTEQEPGLCVERIAHKHVFCFQNDNTQCWPMAGAHYLSCKVYTGEPSWLGTCYARCNQPNGTSGDECYNCL